MEPIKLGNLHLHPIDYAIKYSNEAEFTYGPFHVTQGNPITKDNRILLQSTDRNNSLDLNLNNTQADLLEWLYRLQERLQTSEKSNSINNLIKILSTHNTPTNSYVYIFHSLDGIPEYIEVKHDYSQRKFYKGSSEIYTPKPSSLVKIVAKDLTPRLGLQIENFVIERLRTENYNLLNETYFSDRLRLTDDQIISYNLNQTYLPTIETFNLN